MGLPGVILDTQSAFVPGNLINDDLLIAFGIFHFPTKKLETRERRGVLGFEAGYDSCLQTGW